MNWLKFNDDSFDDLLTDSYHQREMEMENHINKIRFVGLMALFLLELFVGLLGHGWDSVLIGVDLASMIITAIWCWLVGFWITSGKYKPWLKYTSILFDYLIILMITLEMEYLAEINHFLRDLHQTQFELMLISALILFNIMSAFRQGKIIIYFSTLCCLITTTIILEHGHTARTIQVHEQIIVLFSGLLAWSLSHYITNTYTRLRHRERLLRYLPEKLVSAVETGTVDIELGGERRSLTILMADIRNFTSLCETHDAEVVTGILNQYFSAMNKPIFNHDGMIDKYIGDAIMAVFGAPNSKGNDARNAILAAQAMQTELAQLNQAFKNQGLPQLQIGIGIHSGEAIAGNVGSNSRMDYTIIGDTVNVAARIESQTKLLGYRLLVSENTKVQSGLDNLSKVANVKLKGRDQTIDVFCVD